MNGKEVEVEERIKEERNFDVNSEERSGNKRRVRTKKGSEM